ncbi:glycosyltransferase family 2 protein [Salinivibrio sp. PR932]|uniref:glycosyltransferase family 2 protein n=1 Tax=Salinivibrio sp. PR932 TaxID=1909492 RepID=UPI000988A826|nr:glycosyltransferase family 2 protein [Salinivibrio sp. PR932]
MSNMDKKPQLTSWVGTSDDEIARLIEGPIAKARYYWLSLCIAEPWRYQGFVVEFINHDGRRQYLPVGASLHGVVKQWIALPRGARAVRIRDCDLSSHARVRLDKKCVKPARSIWSLGYQAFSLLVALRRRDIVDHTGWAKQVLNWWRRFGLRATYQKLQLCKVRSPEVPLENWWHEHYTQTAIDAGELKARLGHHVKDKVVVWIFASEEMTQASFIATLESCSGQDAEIWIDSRIQFDVPTYVSARVATIDMLCDNPRWNWCLIVPVGAKLLPYAVTCFYRASINQNHIKVIYSDHVYGSLASSVGSMPDRISLKPDWCLERQRAAHYCGDVLFVERSVLTQFKALWSAEKPMSCAYSPYSLLLALAETQLVDAFHHVRIPLWLQTYTHRLSELNTVLTQHLYRCGISAERIVSEHCVAKLNYTSTWQPVVSIVIPFRDNVVVTQQCIDSVLTLTEYAEFEILLVDNQSQESETFIWLQEIERHPKVRVLNYDDVFNFSAINNFAVEHAHGEVVILLNNDTQVISGNWIEAMVGCLTLPAVGVVGAQLLFSNGLIQHAGCVVGPRQVATHRLAFQSLGMAEKRHEGILVQEVSAVTAACLAMRKSLYQSLGGLNEQLTVAFNDVDLCLRVREKGLRVMYTPFAQLYHHESLSRGKDSTPEKQRRAAQEVEFMHQRWSIKNYSDPFYHPMLDARLANFNLNPFPQESIDWSQL